MEGYITNIEYFKDGPERTYVRAKFDCGIKLGNMYSIIIF